MKQTDISVEILGHFGSDDTVANAARVSFHKDSTNYSKEQNDKLIIYLAKHKHFSPFNHAFLSFRVKAPIFVGRQLVKHKFLPWNEVSRRYVDEEPEFYLPPNDEYRKKADNVKQGSSDEFLEEEFFGNFCDLPVFPKEFCNIALDLYTDALMRGVCAEQARMFLPQNMMTEWIWSGTLGAFCDMLVLRLDPHTQYESRIVANKIKELIEPVFPVSLKARLENA